MPPNAFLKNQRRGSIVLLVMVAVVMMLIIGMAFNESAKANVRSIYRFKINEQALAIGDGLVALAKKIVEKQANEPGEPVYELLKAYTKNPAERGPRQVFSIGADGSGTGLAGYGNAKALLTSPLGLVNGVVGGRAGQSIEAKASVELLEDSQVFPGYSTVKSPAADFKGKIRINLWFRMQIFAARQDDEDQALWTEPKTVSTEFEFKSIRVQPPVLRDFTLFIKDATHAKEKPGDYANDSTTYNRVVVRANGRVAHDSPGGYIVLDNGGGDKITEDLGDNPFKYQKGYVLLGTGGDKDKGIHLNLTAGNKEAAETFHLYRGDQGTSDFYQLFTSDYASMLEKSSDKVKQGNAAKQFEAVKELLAEEYEDNGMEPASGMPYYYMARKDYGYADDWKKHPEFGFKLSSHDEDFKIPANSLHLFGDIENGESPTVVFGNVFRRCLSLSGYKQVKNTSGGSGGSGFEIQAGGVYYYENFQDLHNHKLYLHPGYDKAPRRSADFAPIEVWDARTNWTWPFDESKGLRGQWTYISGDGLMMRLIPSIQALFSQSGGEKLFNATVGMPTTGSDLYDALLDDVKDGSGRVLVSPFLKAVHEKCGDEWPKVFEDFPKWSKSFCPGGATQGEMSAYMREVLLNFYFNAFEAYRFGNGGEIDDSMLESPPPSVPSEDEPLLRDAADRWLDIINTIEDMDSDKAKEYSYSWTGGRWAKQSKFAAAKELADYTSGSDLPVFPFTLPDPWAMPGRVDDPIKRYEDDRKAQGVDYLFEDQIHEVVKGSSKSDSAKELFEEYFKNVMTDPAWVLPYNFSGRFMHDEFKEMYFAQGTDPDAVMSQTYPEFRDSVGYVSSSHNPYMEPDSGSKDVPLGPRQQEKIIAHYKNQGVPREDLQAYFFAAEMQAANLEQVDLGEIYQGRCSYRFKRGEDLNSFYKDMNDFEIRGMICIDGDLTFEGSQTDIRGSGVIKAGGTISFSGDVEAPNVVFTAPKFTTRSGRDINTNLIQTSGKFELAASSYRGMVAANGLSNRIGKESMGAKSLSYNPDFLKASEVEHPAVSFQPYLSRWTLNFGAEE